MSNELVIYAENDHNLAVSNSFARFCAMAQTFPYLSADEELMLVKQLRENQDLNAAKKLVMSHLRLVVKTVREHARYGLPLEDLAQEGSIGLMKAVKKYNPVHGARLATYAVIWIKAEIQEFILNNWRLVKIGGSKAMKKLFFGLRKAKEALGLEVAQPEQVAKILGVKAEEVQAAQAWFEAQPLSLNQTDAENNSLVEVLSAEGATPEEYLIEMDTEDKIKQGAQIALASLTEREREVVTRRMLSEPQETLNAVAQALGVSLERVRQIEKNALQKMKTKLGIQYQMLLH